MKGSPTDAGAARARSPILVFLQALIPFFCVAFLGSILTSVCALFVYANAVDVRARDGRFLEVAIPGFIASIVFGYIAARRSVEMDPDRQSSVAFSLLKKYRRRAQQTGGDGSAGQYNIGEQYLRDLLGRRGA